MTKEQKLKAVSNEEKSKVEVDTKLE